ncbi:MutS-like protein [Allomyces arbusculus]|nr:MutS-like protein [Allomyces arbusculus]
MSDKDDRPALDLDKAAQQGFVAFFRSLPAKDPTTLRLFARKASSHGGGDFYSAHGDDALLIAQEFFKTSSVLKHLGPASNPLPGCTLSYANFQQLLADALLNRGWKIQIWHSTGRAANQWQLAREASPGNLQQVEHDLPDSAWLPTAAAPAPDPVLVAILIQDDGQPASTAASQAAAPTTRHVGVALANASDKTLALAEIHDTDQLAHLEALLIQLGVKEVLVPTGVADARLSTLLDAATVVTTRYSADAFNSPPPSTALHRLLSTATPPAAADSLISTHPLAARALGAVLDFLDLATDRHAAHQFSLTAHHVGGSMRLDQHAVAALNLVGDGARKSTHLYGLLNKCVTAAGSRTLQSWIRQPLVDRAAIETRLGIVEALMDDAAVRDAVRDWLTQAPDVGRLGMKLRKDRATLADVAALYRLVARLPDLRPVLVDDPSSTALANRYASVLDQIEADLAPFTEKVMETLDLDAWGDHNDVRIRASLDPELEELHEQMASAREEIGPEASRVAGVLGLELGKVVKVDQSAIHGHHLRVSLTHSSLVRQKKKDLIELATLKSGVLFTTPALRAVSNKLTDLAGQYDTLQAAMVKEFMAAMQAYLPSFTMLNDTLSELDVFAGFAHVSVHAPTPYVRPTLNNEGRVHLPNLRHPCIEMQDLVQFIPNDATLVRGESAFQIITGPNMGGKSTYARSVGLAALMTQLGCFIPTDPGATLPIFDAIQCRIGAGDQQFRGVSTFMAEMLETASILRSATPQSLVIMDELGRGTSTYDGFGLAYAIAHYLATVVKPAATLFATHFHELTTLADKVPGVVNRHVVAHVDEEGGQGITLLYKVADGAATHSYGIHVAKLAGFAPRVVALAQAKADELERAASHGGGGGGKKRGREEEDSAVELARRIVAEVRDVDVNAPDAREKVVRIRKRYAAAVRGCPRLAALVGGAVVGVDGGDG